MYPQMLSRPMGYLAPTLAHHGTEGAWGPAKMVTLAVLRYECEVWKKTH
jgi:hypothetical protein